MAQSGHGLVHCKCPLLGVKQTSIAYVSGNRRGGLRQPILLYCVIAVLLNAVLALAWVLWREVAHNHSLAAQVIELQDQLKKR